MAEKNEEQVVIKDENTAVRVDNVQHQIESLYKLTFPTVYKDVEYTGFKFWPSVELTGKVQEMIFDSPMLRSKSWETSRAILSRVIKELVTEEGETLTVAPAPQGSLVYSKRVDRYRTAEAIVNEMYEPDTNMAAFVYQRDFIDEDVEGSYTCRSCGKEFSMEEDLNDYRVAEPKEAILRFLIGIENGCSVFDMQNIVQDEDIDKLWSERFPVDKISHPVFEFRVKKGYSNNGVACKDLSLRILKLHQTVQLSKIIMEDDGNKPMAATHARFNMMLANVSGAEDMMAVTRAQVVKGFGAADYGKLSSILPAAFERIYVAKTRVCSECGFSNKNMLLDMMTFFGMGNGG